MNADDNANEILSDLARDLGFGPDDLRLKDGYTCLDVDKTSVLHLRLREDSGELDLFMELGVMPPGNREAMLADMLQGNVLFQATAGAALGYDQARDIAVLTRRLALTGLDGVGFREHVELFLTTASFWRQRLHGGAKDNTAPEGSISGQPMLRV